MLLQISFLILINAVMGLAFMTLSSLNYVSKVLSLDTISMNLRTKFPT